MNRNRILGLLIAVAAFSLPLHAATLYVDTDDMACDDLGTGTMQVPFCTIQAGYDFAADSDELRVMPGTYSECVLLFDLATQKGVNVVADAWLNSNDNSVTIIDGAGVLNCTFPISGLPAAVVNIGGFGGRFEGFTVRGGSDSGIFGVGPVTITNNVVRDNTSSFGGGIYVYTASCYYGDTNTQVTNNDVIDNTAALQGGGISVAAGLRDVITDPAGACVLDGSTTVTVDNNVITGNVSDADGGGIIATTYSDPTHPASIVITQNTITSNQASTDLVIGYGGGIYGLTYGYGTESIEVKNNTLALNTTRDNGGGASLSIVPDGNNTNLTHDILVDTNSVTGNEAGVGGGGLDLFVSTRDLRIAQDATMRAVGNTITGNSVTTDDPDLTFGGGGILGFNESLSSNAVGLGFLLENNRISNNTSVVFGGGISLFASADADPDGTGNTASAAAEFELRNNSVTQNDASTNAVGWDATGGGVFMLLETWGDALSRVDMPLNMIADNTIDTINEVGGIHAEAFIGADTLGVEGEAALTLDSSIVVGNDGVGFGGPMPGQPGHITSGGSDNFVVTMQYNDLFQNEAGDHDGWIANLQGNIFDDPLLAPLTYIPERCSPTVDTGNPAFAFDGEPSPNGARVNMGHTGDTTNAALSIADATGDGVVDGVDIVRLSVAFGTGAADPRYNAAVDVNADTKVDGDDLALMATDFGRICP